MVWPTLGSRMAKEQNRTVTTPKKAAEWPTVQTRINRKKDVATKRMRTHGMPDGISRRVASV